MRRRARLPGSRRNGATRVRPPARQSPTRSRRATTPAPASVGRYHFGGGGGGERLRDSRAASPEGEVVGNAAEDHEEASREENGRETERHDHEAGAPAGDRPAQVPARRAQAGQRRAEVRPDDAGRLALGELELELG